MRKDWNAIRKEDYLSFVQETSSLLESEYDARLSEWKRTTKPEPVWGYNPPAFPLEAAAFDAFFYALRGEESRAIRAAERLASYGEFRHFYPGELIAERPEYGDGLPPIPSFFFVLPSLVAYGQIRDCPAISEPTHRRIEEVLAESIPSPIARMPWGSINSSALWVATYAAAMRIFPHHPKAGLWRQGFEAFVDDHWGAWTVEDSQIYHGLWLHPQISMAEILGRPDFFRLPTTLYYLRYFVHLLSPTGMLPEFGDARLNDEWPPYVACLERGATEYRDAEMKFAARKIFSRMAALASPRQEMIAMHLMDAYRWADDAVEARPPVSGSEEVLDEAIGKKLVFRSGWGDDDAYLMMNYRDEFGLGLNPRTQLKNTIMVRAEKSHHGHADENSICLLASGGGVLLHDSGYREELATGAFRADFYHNRLIGRRGARHASQPLLEFLDDSGSYKRLRTEKVHFYRFAEMDSGRTRVHDPEVGYVWDRCLCYLKRPELFVIFDSVRVTRDAPLTLSNLFYTQTVLSRGPGWFETVYQTIPTDGMTPVWPARDWDVRGRKTLLIAFLNHDRITDGDEAIRRSYQTERCIYQTIGGDFASGQYLVFVTVLVPHEEAVEPAALASSLRLVPSSLYPAAAGVRLRYGGSSLLIAVKLNLEHGILDSSVRPRFVFGTSRVTYDELVTDASVCLIAQRDGVTSYAAAEMTRVDYRGNSIFAGTPISCLQPDITMKPGVIRQRQWEGTVGSA